MADKKLLRQLLVQIYLPLSTLRIALLAGLTLIVGISNIAVGQNLLEPRRGLDYGFRDRGRDQIYLDNRRPGTAYSAAVEAWGKFAKNYGKFLESEAKARKTHAEAYSKELDNWEKFVDKKISIKRKWKAWFLEQHPQYRVRQENISKIKRKQVLSNPEQVLKGDLTNEMNDLLVWLATSPFGYVDSSAAAGEGSSFSDLDKPLSQYEQSALLLTVGSGPSGKSGVSFRANSKNGLQTEWPIILQQKAFDEDREKFAKRRDELVKLLSKDQLETEESMTKFNSLTRELRMTVRKMMLDSDAYYRQYKKSQPDGDSKMAAWRENYKAGLYLASLQDQLQVVAAGKDARAFDGSLTFRGNSVIDLIYHMNENGLKFVKGQPKDRGVYEKVFYTMRNVYGRVHVPEPERKASADQ